MPPIRIPRYTGHQSLELYLDEVARSVETSLNQIASAAGVYAVSNTTDTRTLNGTTATLADTVNVLGTLIADLRRKGTLG